MSDLVNVVPNLESSLKIQVKPIVNRLAEELSRTEKSSFNTSYLKRVKADLNTVMMFNEFMTESITGSEEHDYYAARTLLSSISNYFGISSISSTDVKTYDIAEIPDLPDPVYDGPPSTLISAVETYTGERLPHYVTLTWLSDAQFVSYRIFRNGNLIAEIPTGDVTTYEDHTIARGKVYTYTVETTVETFGVLPISNGVTVSTEPPISITAPVISLAESDQNVVVSWGAVPNVDYYEVYRDNVLVASPNSYDTSWTDTHNPLNQTLNYHMYAYHTQGLQSAKSNVESIYVTYLQPIYTPSIQSVSVQSTKVRVTWNNNGNLQNTKFNIYWKADADASYTKVSEVTGIRTSSSEGNWNAYYDVTTPNVIDPYTFYVTATLDGRETSRSDILGINQLEDPADIKLWVNGIASSNWPMGGQPFPINNTFVIEAEYGVVNSEITTGSIVATATNFSAPNLDYGTTVTSANDYYMTDTMVAGSAPSSTPAYLSVTVTFVGSHQQIVATNTYVLPLGPVPVLPAFYIPNDLNFKDRSAEVWGTGAHKVFRVGDTISIGTTQFNILSLGAVALNKVDITFTLAYAGAQTILAGTEVVNLGSGGPVGVITTTQPVSSGTRSILVDADFTQTPLQIGDRFGFDGYPGLYTVETILLGRPGFDSSIIIAETYFGSTIPIGTQLIIT